MRDKIQLFWRVLGETSWRNTVLKTTDNPSHFSAEIPYHQKGKTVEYYITAESKSGRKETQPRTAPLGLYQFKIE